MPHASEHDIRSALQRELPSCSLSLIERMKCYIEPDISCSRFFGMACFTEESIRAYRSAPDSSHVHLLEQTELGSHVAKHLRGGLFIDIPCGLHAVREADKDFEIVPLAQAVGAEEVWEIDRTAEVVEDRLKNTASVLDAEGKYQYVSGVGEIGIRTQGEMRVATMQDEMLGFLSKCEHIDTRPLAIYVSGVQPDASLIEWKESQREIVVPYLQALYLEFNRLCTSGDLVILNSSDMLVTGLDEEEFPDIHPALALPQRGFSLMRRCAYNKVHVFRKD